MYRAKGIWVVNVRRTKVNNSLPCPPLPSPSNLSSAGVVLDRRELVPHLVRERSAGGSDGVPSSRDVQDDHRPEECG